MGAILPFSAKQSPGETPVETAWRAYYELARRQLDDPELALNLEHNIAVMRAHRKWADLFLAEDAA